MAYRVKREKEMEKETKKRNMKSTMEEMKVGLEAALSSASSTDNLSSSSSSVPVSTTTQRGSDAFVDCVLPVSSGSWELVADHKYFLCRQAKTFGEAKISVSDRK